MRFLLIGCGILLGAIVLVVALFGWAIFGPAGPLSPNIARFSSKLTAASGPVAASEALDMKGLQEICVIPEYVSVDDVFAPHGYQMKSGVRLKPNPRFRQAVIFAHTGLLAVSADRQVYFEIDLMRDDVALVPNVDLKCISGADAQFRPQEAGWWDLDGTEMMYWPPQKSPLPR